MACLSSLWNSAEGGTPPTAAGPAELAKARPQQRPAAPPRTPSCCAQTPVALTTALAGQEDRGIYADLNSKVRLTFPSWLRSQPVELLASASGGPTYVFVAGRAVGFADATAFPPRQLTSFGPQDADADSIPDPLDILIGAKKVALAAAPYRETYRTLSYPGGDVPRDEGVCTDVVVRALRNAGFDLQKLVYEDFRRRPRVYPAIERPDRSIDHRRVRNLVPYFTRHWERLPADPRDHASPWLPGDIVFFDTMRGPDPDHLGIVSDRLGPSGLPLIVNSWTTGYASTEMDLLASVPVTHRFRVPAPASRGTAGAGHSPKTPG